MKARVRLRVVGGPELELREGVPRTRGDCKGKPRPCPFYRCRYHLWFQERDDRPGNPWRGDGPGSEIEPRWLEWPTPPSCALDVADSIPPGETMPFDAIGSVIGRSEDAAEIVVDTAITKLAGHRDMFAIPTPPKKVRSDQ